MKRLLYCGFNLDSACAELKFSDGSALFIDIIAVGNEAADNMHQRPELDYLIYNDAIAYDDIISLSLSDFLRICFRVKKFKF